MPPPVRWGLMKPPLRFPPALAFFTHAGPWRGWEQGLMLGTGSWSGHCALALPPPKGKGWAVLPGGFSSPESHQSTPTALSPPCRWLAPASEARRPAPHSFWSVPLVLASELSVDSVARSSGPRGAATTFTRDRLAWVPSPRGTSWHPSGLGMFIQSMAYCPLPNPPSPGWASRGRHLLPAWGLGDKAKGLAVRWQSSSVSSRSSPRVSQGRARSRLQVSGLGPALAPLQPLRANSCSSSSEMRPNYCKILMKKNECLSNGLLK